MFQLTKQLMEIPSVSGNEREVGQFLAQCLASRGCPVELQEVERDRFNVISRSDDARVMFCTHIDTVPPVLDVHEDERFLYGRGACDTKGIIAAMLEAGDALRKSGFVNFGYLFVVGEETTGAGAKAANTLKWDSQFVIVGEPTGNKLAQAQKGIFMVDLKFEGRAAHSGYPEEGVSAVEGLWGVLADCKGADWGNHRVLGKGSLNIGVFNGGERCNIVPGRAEASIMIRTVEPRAAVEERLRRIVGTRAAVHIVGGADPHLMHVVDGFETTVVSFGSDVPYLGNLGKPLLIGPGSILDAHTAHEKIPKEELVQGAAIYQRLARKLVA